MLSEHPPQCVQAPREGYSSETMTSCWTRIAPFVLCVAFAALGIWSLAVGDYATGVLQFAFSALWLLMAFWDRRPAVLGKRQNGV